MGSGSTQSNVVTRPCREFWKHTRVRERVLSWRKKTRSTHPVISECLWVVSINLKKKLECRPPNKWYSYDIISCDFSKCDYHSQCKLPPELVAGHSFDSFMHNKYSSFEGGFDFWGRSRKRGVIKWGNADFGLQCSVIIK